MESMDFSRALRIHGLDHNSRAVSHLSEPAISGSTPAASTNRTSFGWFRRQSFSSAGGFAARQCNSRRLHHFARELLMMNHLY